MLTLEVHPGTSLGPFALKASLRSIISLLRSNRSISNIDFIFSEKDPLQHDYVLHLTNDGIAICIDPISQIVTKIDVLALSKCRLVYAGKAFSGGAFPCTLAATYELFGPTYPGEFNKEDGAYTLRYPGLSIVFSIPLEHRGYYEGDLELNDGTTPRAVSLSIWPRSALDADAFTPLMMSKMRPSSPSTVFSLFEGWKDCPFGSSAQDVLAALGSPDEVFPKTLDKLRIHSPMHGYESTTDDYVFNYFEKGLDIVFDGSQHTVIKVVAHTNLPMTPSFHRYAKCNFVIAGLGITADSTWGDIQTAMEDSGGRPLVHGSTLSNNPFGGSRFFAFDGALFEVLRNGHIGSVTLFDPSLAPTPSTTASG